MNQKPEFIKHHPVTSFYSVDHQKKKWKPAPKAADEIPSYKIKREIRCKIINEFGDSNIVILSKKDIVAIAEELSHQYSHGTFQRYLSAFNYLILRASFRA